MVTASSPSQERAFSDAPILCINAGSSSLKMALFGGDRSGLRRLAEGVAERIGGRGSRLVLGRGVCRRRHEREIRDHRAALDLLLDELLDASLPCPTLIGHRVAHGGPHHLAPHRIEASLLARLNEAVPLAPLHLPAALDTIDATTGRYPDAFQVACFDTAFHATLPEVAWRLPLPQLFASHGLRRYGFHGLSYEYVMSVLGTPPPARVVIAHLGSGASLVAVKDGRSCETTMGLTPTGGVMMGTRTGDLDPGVLIWLAREHGLSTSDIEHLVNRESGLLAIAGTADMETALERASNDAGAALAVDMFVHSVKKALGGLIAVLEGIDLLVFTGGIGENAPAIRAAVCRGLDGLGITLDAQANDLVQGDGEIGGAGRRCRVRVVRTDEDAVVARHTLDVALSSRT